MFPPNDHSGTFSYCVVVGAFQALLCSFQFCFGLSAVLHLRSSLFCSNGVRVFCQGFLREAESFVVLMHVCLLDFLELVRDSSFQSVDGSSFLCVGVALDKLSGTSYCA